MTTTTPFVSVIVPVFNDPERLALCLQALENQTYPHNSYEVIAVDNGSDESIEPIVARFCQARTTYEGRSSSYAARNKGISLAQGEVIAFTDADSIPFADWIEKGVAHLLRSPRCGLVAGRVEIFCKHPARPTTVELYERLTAFQQKVSVELGKYGATVSLFTLKTVLAQVGLFDADVKSGGDIEWGHRVSAFGYELIYAEDTCVAHPARHSFAQLYKRVTRVIGGFYDLNRKKRVPYLGLGRGFIIDSFPPINASLEVLRSQQLKGVTDKIRVIFVMFFVQYVQVWERMRLMAGGESSR
jgi:glycosyltransferase involved in cell wall biosynthesis